MNFLAIDLETYSSTNLAKSGIYRYCEADDFEILLFAYSVEGKEVHVVDMAQGESIPDDILLALRDGSIIKWAFNAAFERICLSRFLGLPTGTYLDPVSWRCTMIWSAYLGLPLSLMGVGSVLGLGKQKLSEGKDLIRYFCTPCNPTITNGGRTRNDPDDAPDKWRLFIEYNRRDVEVELAIHQRLARFPVPDAVWDEYHLDQRINDRGVLIDGELVRSAIELDTLSRQELMSRMRELTDLENPNSVSQVKTWLSENGLEVDSLGKKDVKAALKDAPRQIQEVLELRLQLAKSSIKKYQAMENAACSDGRARGMFQFYGANRTGRWSGRLIQVQNLRQNHLEDLGTARALVGSGDYEAVKLLYGDVPDTLSQLVRTAFIPRKGYRFIVSDFSAIEARVLSWLAGETWRMGVFANNGDIYCATASRMFHCEVSKHGENGHLRQKGKQAELACIAEGQMVLTDQGLVPIEYVTTDHLLWDGENWVSHGGVVYKGRREVITYGGLTATADHLVWIEGKSEPVHLGIAATCGSRLVQTGDGGKAIRVGADNIDGETMECQDEPLLCAYPVCGMPEHPMAGSFELDAGKIKGMPALFPAEGDSDVARSQAHGRKAAMRESEGRWVSQLRCTGHPLCLFQCERVRIVPHRRIRTAGQGDGDRSHRQRQGLRSRQLALRNPQGKQPKQAQYCPQRIQADTLAVFVSGGDPKAFCRCRQKSHHRGRHEGCYGEKKKLANKQRTAGLYDIRNTGRHHRFTVSGVLVHNCGYGGSAGALKAMGALESGMTEGELKPLVDAWRQSNPNIVRFWWDVDEAAKQAVRNKTATSTHGIRFSYESGFLFITLLSGRRLAYVKPRIGANMFGSDCVTFEGVGATKKWERIDTYGPKLVENIVQAISRDLLCHAMQQLEAAGCRIVMHIHDEAVIEAPPDINLQSIETAMALVPDWAQGLLLNADGYETNFYKKD
jgi:DNA polymerase